MGQRMKIQERTVRKIVWKRERSAQVELITTLGISRAAKAVLRSTLHHILGEMRDFKTLYKRYKKLGAG